MVSDSHESTDTHTWLMHIPIWPGLVYIKLVGSCLQTYQLSHTELLQQLDGQQLTHQRSRLTGAAIAWIGVDLLVELQAVCHEGVQGRSGEMGCSDLLVDWFDEELRHLRRS